jgi:hypothetical protein
MLRKKPRDTFPVLLKRILDFRLLDIESGNSGYDVPLTLHETRPICTGFDGEPIALHLSLVVYE